MVKCSTDKIYYNFKLHTMRDLNFDTGYDVILG